MYVPDPRLLNDTLYDPSRERAACGVGFVADIDGRRSNQILRHALTVLVNLRHRGACGCEPNTGDGAGVLFQMPHAFFRAVCAEAGINLPAAGAYGVGMVYLPPDPQQRAACEARLEETIREAGQTVLGWRTVPTNDATLGASAQSAEPVVRQIFIGRSERITDDLAFERKLYVIRQLAEHAILRSELPGREHFYIPSLSYKTIVYKGMLTSQQLEEFYPDLADPAMDTALAMIHSRFSTNTFPSWARSQPFRYMLHNGEINTIRGNLNWMNAREKMLVSELFGDDLPKLLPIIDAEGSDSAMFDNALELLVLGGRPLAHAAMMMIPEPWEHDHEMSDARRAFYEYHGCLMEPWDGPASILFSDGVTVGAMLDRNGLRPSRYYLTKDNLVVLASEVGVLDIPAEDIVQKGRLQPGKMLLVDTASHRLITDAEIKEEIAAAYPYRQWLDQNMVDAGGSSRADRGAPGRPLLAAPAPAGVRLYVRGSQHDPCADGTGWRRADRVDGQRYPAGRPVAKTAAPLQLFPAALRPGHQPAHRCAARGDRHRHRRRAGVGAQPAQPGAGKLPAAEDPQADPDRSAARQAAPRSICLG